MLGGVLSQVCVKKPTIILSCLGVLCATVWLMSSTAPPEPRYQGRKLTEWLGDMEFSDAGGYLSASATKAIRAMGTNALPYLLWMVESEKDSPSKNRANRLLEKQSVIKFRFTSYSYSCGPGASGFAPLGETAAPAVPRLMKLLENPRTSLQARFALMCIGSPAFPSLAEALTNKSAHVRAVAAEALSCMPWDLDYSRIVVSRLMKNLDDAEEQVRYWALVAIPFGAAQAIPKIKELQSDPSFKVRRQATSRLQDLGVVQRPQ